MWFGKSSLKAAALVLVGAISSMAAKSSISPLTFETDSYHPSAQQEVKDWNYLTKFKIWGTTGVQFGWRPEFFDPRYYNTTSGSISGYKGVNILDSLGWVGTATGNLSSENGKSGGWLDGPIIVGGAITANDMKLITGPVRVGSGRASSGGTFCSKDDNSDDCAYDKVPQIRADLKVPTLSGIDWNNYEALNLHKMTDKRETYINISKSGQKTCPKTGICDLYFSSIDFAQDNRLVIQMPDGGRITRIFTNSLTTLTHPQIVVNYGNGDLSASEYEGNLLVYINSDVSFQNSDYADFMGTYVVNGTLTGKSNMTVVGQFIANKIVIGDDFKAKNFVFKPFIVWPELSILGNDAINFEESDSWQQINVALSSESTEPVTFEYCFDFNSNSEDGVNGKYAGYKDVGAADASHKFPICNKNQSQKVTIPVGETKAKVVYIKPLIDGLVEDKEVLWFQVKNLEGAQLASNYETSSEGGSGYKIYIISNDKAPTVESELVVNVNEDDKHTFTKNEFKFKHASQTFASVIITGLPTVDADSLKLNGVKVDRDQVIDVANLGKLTYKPKADAFGNKYATFKYKVVGSGTGDNTSKEYTATINVLPVNDKPSVITNGNNEVVFTVMESGELSGGKAEVKDKSNERNIDTYTFSLVNVTGSDYTVFNQKFELVQDNSQNMTVKLKSGATLDYAAISNHQYVVYATVEDNAKTEKNASVTNAGPLTSDRFKIVVKIKNVNDKPTISGQTFEMYEKQPDGSDWPVNTEVGLFTKASDPDGDNLTYSLPSDVPFKFVTPKNGKENNMLVVKDGGVLDYETKSTWTFKVTASDGEYTVSANITVKLKDVNEKPIPSDIKEYSINENSAVDAVVGTFKIFDNDKISGSFETLTLTLSGALTGADSITTKLKNKTLADIFYLKQTAIDDKGYRTISILVKNKSLLDYEALYKQSAENASTGDAKYDVTLTIKDDKSTVTKKTKISVLDVNEPFTATGGTFYLLEHSSGASFVCNQKHKEGVCADGNGKVKAVDEDKRSTTFSKLTYKISTNNTGSNAKDAKNFVVDNQGYIKTASDAEFEYDGVGAQHSYTFLVTVSDVGFSKDVEVTVKIENIDEPKNVVVAKGEVAVREDKARNDEVDAITDKMLTDAGVSRGDIEYYEIGSVLQNGKASTIGSSIFGIDEENGRIIINSTKYLDYEELYPNNKFSVQVTVHTKGPSNDFIIDRTLVVTDVNERPVSRDTVFEGVKESLAGGGSVGVLWATDPDSCSTSPEAACKDALHPHPLKFNKLNFAIVDGADLPFEIDQNSGEITLKEDEELNFNEHEFYKFNVRISDRALDKENPPLSTTVEVIIKIEDVNKPSRFEVLSDLYEINENVSKGTELDGDYIVVYDDDADDVDNLKITITGKDGTDAAKLFEVVPQGKTDPATHLTTFAIKTKANLDYEKLYKESKNGALFNVTLKIVDGSDNPTTKETVLRVNDVNEEPKFINLPEDCVDGGYCFEIAENVKEATILGKAEADDPDVYTPKYSTLYFSIENGDAAMFDIDISSGEISTISNVKYDYETTPIYHFDVVVTDKKHTKTVPVTVTLKNKPEPPVLPDPPPAMNVDENSKKGTTVGVIVATDDDCKGSHKATCAMPLYTLEASDVAANDYKAFTIDENGIIKVAADNSLNYEVKNEYYVRVVATDGDDPTLSTAVDLTIMINDVNDVPTYEQKEYVFEIHENAPKGEFVGSVVADDEDTWSVLKYALSDYDEKGDADYFKIDSEGKITLKKTVNYETKKTIHCLGYCYG